MPGVKGHSGGSDRVSAAQHRARGTYRHGRHGMAAQTDAEWAHRRLADLRVLYACHVAQHARLREAEAAASTDRTRLRELRQETATIRGLMMSMHVEEIAVDAEAPAPPPADAVVLQPWLPGGAA